MQATIPDIAESEIDIKEDEQDLEELDGCKRLQSEHRESMNENSDAEIMDQVQITMMDTSPNGMNNLIGEDSKLDSLDRIQKTKHT